MDQICLSAVSRPEGSLNVDGAVIYDLVDRSIWVGILGIGHTVIPAADDTTYPSLLGSLSNTGVIPSTSWGYSAGAQYR